MTCEVYFICTDTCDPSWQSTRDDLIIAAHVISDLAFLVEVVAVMFLCIAVCCWDNCKSSYIPSLLASFYFVSCSNFYPLICFVFL